MGCALSMKGTRFALQGSIPPIVCVWTCDCSVHSPAGDITAYQVYYALRCAGLELRPDPARLLVLTLALPLSLAIRLHDKAC